jgi:hypothetical protein
LVLPLHRLKLPLFNIILNRHLCSKPYFLHVENLYVSYVLNMDEVLQHRRRFKIWWNKGNINWWRGSTLFFYCSLTYQGIRFWQEKNKNMRQCRTPKLHVEEWIKNVENMIQKRLILLVTLLFLYQCRVKLRIS